MTKRGGALAAAATAAVLALHLPARCAAEGTRDAPIVADAIQYLDSALWTATNAEGLAIRATVPGDVVSDMHAAGLIPDPWLDLTWRQYAGLWDSTTLAYSTTFSSPPAAAGARVWLVFDGVKMAATLSLNGKWLGNATNQFIRYRFDVTDVLAAGPGANTLSVEFPPTSEDPRNDEGGTNLRWAAYSGGWDWAPYSNETTGRSAMGVRTFTKGIWKSVYLATVTTAALTGVKIGAPAYQGAYPTAPLTDATAGGWVVNVTAYLSSPGGASGSLTVTPQWDAAHPATVPVTLPAGAVDVPFTATLTVAAGSVKLWWPAGLIAGGSGGQRTDNTEAMYPVTISFTPTGGGAAAPLTATRAIGFRNVALVTADDSNPAALAGQPGSGNLTMRLRVNGANVFVRGANWIPMNELEGRDDAAGHVATLQSAADAGMSMLRVWGGGVWPYDVMADTCDRLGLLIFLDAMYASQADSHHFAYPSAEQEAEIRYQLRRLAHHPSIALYDACNECGGSTVFASFVAPTMASEDPSRPVWPSSPSSGWADGVDMLWGTPLAGRTLAIKALPSSVGPVDGCNCTGQQDARYFGFPLSPFMAPLPVASAAACCALCTSTAGCTLALSTSGGTGCQLLGTAYPAPVSASGYLALWPQGHGPIPDVPVPPAREIHGPYEGGGGWPTVNGAGFPPTPYAADLPPSLYPATAPAGPSAEGYFTSEFGVGQPASFESIGSTLSPRFFSMHGGANPPDNCTPGFTHVCTGGNVMAQRNYGCDDAWATYLGVKGSRVALTLDDVGAQAFSGQLYLCQLVTALKLKSSVELFRSQNRWGLLTWQLGEVWPTFGWGSLEYSAGPGSVLGGRWKPSHYLLARGYTDVFAACGADARCYVKNDGALAGFQGTAAVSLLKLASGAVAPVASVPVNLPPGANSFAWSCADGKGDPSKGATCATWAAVLGAAGCAADGTDCAVQITVTAASGGGVVASNLQLLAVPGLLALPSPPAEVTAAVGAPAPDGSVPITLTSTAAALFVTLTTQAQGRFSDNVVAVPGPSAPPVEVRFLPFGPLDAGLLASTLRVDHLQAFFKQQ